MSEKIKDGTYRPLVYICSPLSGDVAGNTERAKQFCRFALDKGQIPLAPHLLFPQFIRRLRNATARIKSGFFLC